LSRRLIELGLAKVGTMTKRPVRAELTMLTPRPVASDTRRAKPPALIVTIKEDYFALLDRLPSKRPAVMVYQADNIPKLVRCCNPRCRSGGLDLSHFIRLKGEHTVQCGGRDRSRRDGQRCDNHWHLTVASQGCRLTR
jgi:hypothetical protein